MSFLRLASIFIFFISGLVLLASADKTPETSPSDANFDSICARTAKQHGVNNPDAWVWSPSEGICINNVQPESSLAHACAPLVKELDNLLASTTQDVFQLSAKENMTELETACRPFLEARVSGEDRRQHHVSSAASLLRSSCPEGLHGCLNECNQFNPGGWSDGETGAWIGCRAACSYLCDSGRGGCWKGWCWAGCTTFVPMFEGVEWCYTTKAWSQDYNYVRCNADSDCDLKWKCAGPCAAF